MTFLITRNESDVHLFDKRYRDFKMISATAISILSILLPVFSEDSSISCLGQQDVI